VCDTAATRPSSQITLGRLVIILTVLSLRDPCVRRNANLGLESECCHYIIAMQTLY